MKNKLEDVRNHLVAAMEALNDETADAEAITRAVDRAKAVSNVANAYIQSVKVEIEAIRLADEVGMLPASIGAPLLTEKGGVERSLQGARIPRLAHGA